ncbi:MAG: FAD-binding domain-containing protein, partial [Pseudomonadota bacterium]
HNHTRMWFASIWIFTLQLPWQLGADLFLRHLLDGDPASNTLSWRWVGGLHTVGKTYLARADNIRKFTNGRFDPKGLARAALPLEEDALHPVVALPAPRAVPDQAYVLLRTEEDCAPMELAPEVTVGAVIAPDGLSPDVVAFRHGAVSAAIGADAMVGPDLVPMLLDVARQAGLSTIVTP